MWRGTGVCRSVGQERGVSYFFARGGQSALNKGEINSATKWLVIFPIHVRNEKVINAVVRVKTVSPTKPCILPQRIRHFS